MRLSLGGLLVLVGLLCASPAQAEVKKAPPKIAFAADVRPSVEYAYQSIYGNTGQAGDNDVKRVWDDREARYGINIVASTHAQSCRVNDHHVRLRINYYYDTNGNGYRDPADALFYVWFSAYVNWAHTAQESYHDGESTWQSYC